MCAIDETLLAQDPSGVMKCYVMRVVITEWALQSYLDLKHSGTFTAQEYWQRIRPDVRLLATSFPGDPRFQVSNFWGPATNKGGGVIPNGFKMKWHNIGPGKVQLRGTVAILHGDVFLCAAYAKNSDAHDKRECAKLMSRIALISQGRVIVRGVLR